MSVRSSHLTVRAVRAFNDNYIWLIESPRQPECVVAVDPGDAAPVLADLGRSGQRLAAILLTHHHPDHIGGVAQLLAQAPVPVVGPEDTRIAQRTLTARDGERIDFADLGLGFETLAVPGHTVSHVAYVGSGALFCGDTLFSAGCGRMFEGTAPQMARSLERLRALPPETLLYCGHEYTAANLRFALTVDPENRAALDYEQRVAALRRADQPTLPSSLALELEVNPCLRCDDVAVRAAAERHAGRALGGSAEVFGTLRAWKDAFR